MKTIKLLCGDIYFQYKYGFYLLYAFFTLAYSVIIYLLPDSWKAIVSAIIIFSDPALIGLVFMGAIVLFEKSERVLHTIAVSPINIHQYIVSKVLSITIISLISGLIIASMGTDIIYLPTSVLGISLGSILFSLVGLIISAKSATLNGFLIKTVPIMCLAVMLAALYLIGYNHWIMQLLPSVSIINLIMDIEHLEIISVCMLTLWIAIIYYFTVVVVRKMMKSLGGDKI